MWDLPTRLFHWGLVAVVGVNLATGYLMAEWWLGVHVLSGYGIMALVAFRLVWGICGSEHSRFARFSVAPRQVYTHLLGILSGRPPRYVGHNPSTMAWMLVMIGLLIGITGTGLITLGGVENQAPLAGVTSFRVGDVARRVHVLLGSVVLFMIGVHLLGILIESCMLRENVAGYMLSGYKYVGVGSSPGIPQSARPLAAVLSLGSIAGVTAIVWFVLAAIPPSGLISLPEHAAYREECSACHSVHHPSLLPASIWLRMMADLQDHFGEDASLDAATTRDIATYLRAYASEAWDTEASNGFRTVSAEEPLRITATSFWIARHQDIAEAVYTRKDIGSKVNCIACHRDADTGRFDDQSIHIPGDRPS